MAEMSPMASLAPPKGWAVTLEDILITSELSLRPPRAPDYASENTVLVALAREMAVNPCNLLQTLVDGAVDLCQVSTAGISVLKTDGRGEYLVCEALSGAFPTSLESRIPVTLAPPTQRSTGVLRNFSHIRLAISRLVKEDAYAPGADSDCRG